MSERPTSPARRGLGSSARILLLAALALGGALIALGSGAVHLSPGDVLSVLLGQSDDALAQHIVWEARLPRVVGALLIGAALAVSGALFQALLRNALAEPYLLGVGPGSLFGVSLAAVAIGGAGALPGAAVRGAAAFVGALGVGALVAWVARRGGRSQTASVLLAGIAVGAFVHAVAMLLLHGLVRDWHHVVRWMLGDLGLMGWTEIGFVAAVAFLGTVVAWWRAPALDLLLLGDEAAWSGGVDARRTLYLLGGVACVLAASTVAVAGLVGFVGLVAPHLARGLVGARHGLLLPATALAGAAILPLADAFARTAFAPEVLPVGVVTAVLGAPFLAALVLRRT